MRVLVVRAFDRQLLGEHGTDQRKGHYFLQAGGGQRSSGMHLSREPAVAVRSRHGQWSCRYCRRHQVESSDAADFLGQIGAALDVEASPTRHGDDHFLVLLLHPKAQCS